MLIIGFDLGTITGAADGMPGGKPRAWTWDLNDAGHGRPAKLALFQSYLDSYLQEAIRKHIGPGNINLVPKGIAIFYEAPLTLAALISMANSAGHRFLNNDSDALLKAMVGILEATAFNAGIRHIEPVAAKVARHAFLGESKAPKERVSIHCMNLGWPTANLNESDACAVWAYGAGVLNPRTAHLTTPLFGG